MKRRLNILCSLVVLVLSLSVLQTIYFLGHAFVDGVNAGYENTQTKSMLGNNTGSKVPDLDIMAHMRSIAVVPNEYSNVNDSIYNVVSNSYVPAHFEQVMVSIPTSPSIVLNVVEYLMHFGTLITALMAFVWFVKLIAKINKGDIFSWDNVQRLRQLGVILILNFLFNFVPTLMDMIFLSHMFAMSNYKLMFSDMFLTINLVLGLLSMIVAQVFAMGLRLQEEHELTI